MKRCPLCESKNVFTQTSIGAHTLIDKTIFQFRQKYLHCNCCKEAFAFPETDRNFMKANKKAQHEFIIKTLKEFKSQGLFFRDIERQFDLPFGILSLWKRGYFSSLSVAFLYSMVNK